MDIQHGNLMELFEQALPALERLGQQVYPPLISDERLKTYELPMRRLVRKPKLRQQEIIGCVAATVEMGDNIILCCQQGTGKTKMALNGIQIAYHWNPVTKTFQGKKTPTGFDGKQPTITWLAPGYLVKKIAREADWEMPGLPILIANHTEDLRFGGNQRIVKRRKKAAPLYNTPIEQARLIIVSYSAISLTASRVLAVNSRVMRQMRSDGNWMLARKAFSGKIAYLHELTCPGCGKPLKDEHGDLHTPETLTPPKGQWMRCWHPKFEKVLDPHCQRETSALLTHYEAAQRAGEREKATEIHRKLAQYYIQAPVLQKSGPHKGEPELCNTPLWAYTADPLPYNGLWDASGRRLGNPSSYELPAQFPGDIPYRIVRSGPRKWALADYLVDHLVGQELPGQEALPPDERQRFEITDVIPDEVHLTKAESSARGMAAAGLMGAASNSVIALTGTLTGGYARTLFYIFYRMLTRMRTDFAYDDVGRWVDQFGIHVTILKSKDGKEIGRDVGINSNRKSESKNIKEVPGLVPGALAYPFPQTVFALIEQVFPELIGLYHDMVYQVKLDDSHLMRLRIPIRDADGNVLIGENGEPVCIVKEMTQQDWYREMTSNLEDWCRRLLAQGSARGLSVMLQTLLKAPNAPHEPVFVKDKKTGDIIVDLPALDTHYVYPKERRVAEQILKDAKQGLRNLVYIQHNGKVDVSQRFRDALMLVAQEQGFPLKVAILRADRPKDTEREEWIAEQVENGIHVLITNPKCVQMGLDLIDFRRINWLQLDYSGYVMQQASRRSLRPGVEGDVEVRYWVYPGIETEALSLMAQKAEAAAQFNGNLIKEALQSQVEESPTALIARKLLSKMSQPQTDVEGIQDLFNKAKQREEAKAWALAHPDFGEEPAAEVIEQSTPQAAEESWEDWLDLDHISQPSLFDFSPIVDTQGNATIPGIVIQGGDEPIVETVLPGSPVDWNAYRARRRAQRKAS